MRTTKTGINFENLFGYFWRSTIRTERCQWNDYSQTPFKDMDIEGAIESVRILKRVALEKM